MSKINVSPINKIVGYTVRLEFTEAEFHTFRWLVQSALSNSETSPDANKLGHNILIHMGTYENSNLWEDYDDGDVE